MKTRCTPAFAATLATLGLTYADWRRLTSAGVRHRWRHIRGTRGTRQTVRKVQRLHTGRGLWWQGQYVTQTREERHDAPHH
jgi:hypothetical protein